MEARDRIIFLSIKPKFAEDILNGAKRWEYRRLPPKINEATPVALYATGSVGAIVGFCNASSVLREPIDILIKHTIAQTTSTEAGLRDYFNGVGLCSALRVDDPSRFHMAYERIRELMPGFAAPQSFFYLRREDAKSGKLFAALEEAF